MIRSLRASASSRYCDVNNVDMPRFLKLATRSQMTCLLRGSRPVVGSSRNTTSGRTTKPQAISIRRRIPPEYVPTRRSAAYCRSNSCRSSSARERAADLLSPCSRPNRSRFSRPVSMSSRATCCPVSMITRRTAAGWATTSKPAILAVPRSGLVSVDNMSTVVVLPAPFGPSNATTSPRPTSKLMPRTASTSPNDLPSPLTTTLFSELVNPVSPVSVLSCLRVVAAAPWS